MDKNSSKGKGGNQNPAEEVDLRLHLTDNSTLQTREEKDSDNKVDVSRDDDISVSEDDLHDPNSDRLPEREENE